MTLASELGRGTTVSIWLPRGDAKAAPEAEELHSPGRGTALLVEDNPDVATASAGLLEQLGYAVRWVADAQFALKEIDIETIDLVLSDIVMPGKIDGLGLARAIRLRHPALPVLLVTGYSATTQSAQGAFPILAKAIPVARTKPGAFRPFPAQGSIGVALIKP